MPMNVGRGSQSRSTVVERHERLFGKARCSEDHDVSPSRPRSPASCDRVIGWTTCRGAASGDPASQMTCFRILALLAIAACSLGNQRMREAQASDVSSACGITLEVSGAQFSPRACVFEIILPGEACSPDTSCPPEYALSMKDQDATHVREVLLFGFTEFSRRTFRLDPARDLKEFDGALLDERAASRNLLSGQVSLEPIVPENAAGVQHVKVSLDVFFPGDIHIRGSGEVPVERVGAP